jgi:hypothetical protein
MPDAYVNFYRPPTFGDVSQVGGDNFTSAPEQRVLLDNDTRILVGPQWLAIVAWTDPIPPLLAGRILNDIAQTLRNPDTLAAVAFIARCKIAATKTIVGVL